MNEFKEGDKVKYMGNARNISTNGVIVEINDYEESQIYTCVFDNWQYWLFENEIELINE